ncbi:MAG: xanthine dehydrogenase family protein subunit M [Thermomicrobiales bacterium]
MHPYPFDYHRATSVDEAIRLLGEHEDDGKILAGGHSLLPVMKLRLAQPAILIDITALDELRGVRLNGDTVEIGALTTHHDIETDAVLAEHLPLLPAIAHVVGDQQVRHRGTFGGTLAHADSAGDYPAGVLALGGEIVARGPNGERTIPVDEFFQGFLTTALEPNELLTSVRIPALTSATGTSYQKFANPASGYAIVGVAVVLRKGGNGAIDSIRVGITGTADAAYRATAVEEALNGTTPDDAALKAATAHATDGIEVLGDQHAPADYRARVTQNLVRRAVQDALANAG